MLLGFKQRFEQFVREGSKTHTIRRLKKHSPKVGDVCHCYGDLRQKSMHLLGRWPCIAVDNVRIDRNPNAAPVALKVRINGELLDADETRALFYRDGFRDPGRCPALQARDFWDAARPRRSSNPAFPFEGQMIHWDFAHPVKSPLQGRRLPTAAGNKSKDGGKP
jgi:hypothetical protein